VHSKYEALETHLKSKARGVGAVTIPFAEIDKMLSSPLPKSTYTHRPWWGNQQDTTNRPQAKAWMSAGFEVESVNQSRTDGWVRFIRSN
jgi:hypothetical protein